MMMPRPPGANGLDMPRELLERVDRLRDFQIATRIAPPQGRDLAKLDYPNRPSPYRVFEGFPKVALPTNLMSATVAALDVLNLGREAVSESQLNPPQDIRTLASWLYLAYGVVKNAGGTVRRTCLSEGDLYPCEIYVAAFGIEGLEPGFYHYCLRDFSLRRLRGGVETLNWIKRGRPDLQFLKNCPAVLLVSTIFCRSTWRYKRRGYRAAVRDAGHLLQNLSLTGNGLGIQTLMRLQVHGKTMRELIGLPPDMTFPEAEAVQGMVVWADHATHPLATPPPPAGVARPPADVPETLPRTPLATEVTGYGSVLAAHEDCVAPGVALREIRPPLTELNPLSKDYPQFNLLKPDPLDNQTLLGKLLLTRSPCERFTQVPISRDDLWWINRLAFRGGTNYPLFPDGPYAALVRPFWVVGNVTGVENAIWYYNPMRDHFSMVKRGVFRAQILKLHLDHPACENAAAICILVANLHRLMTAGGPDLYRLTHLEAGVTCQRLFVAANALRLSANVNGEFYDQDVRALLGVEKTGWEPICSVAIGATGAMPA